MHHASTLPQAHSDKGLESRLWCQSHVQIHHALSALSSPKSEQALLYVLSSPEGAWTDFHVDFGGSLVWYHVLQGAKTFLAIPPSKAALTAYEKWASSPKQVHCRCRAAQHLCVNICNLVFMHGC